jgi:hypothetical protein
MVVIGGDGGVGLEQPIAATAARKGTNSADPTKFNEGNRMEKTSWLSTV